MNLTHPYPREQMALKCVLFDLDGTLIDTDRLTIHAYRRAWKLCMGDTLSVRELMHHDLATPSIEVMRGLLGARGLASEVEAERLRNTFRCVLAEDHNRYVSAFPGVLSTLGELAKRGYVLGLVTSKPERLAQLSLRYCRLDAFFDGLSVFQEDTLRHKPDPEPVWHALAKMRQKSRTRVGSWEFLFVGDSPSDIEAGQRAEGWTAAALWGLQAGNAWQKVKAEAVLAHQPAFCLNRIDQILHLCPGRHSRVKTLAVTSVAETVFPP
jgi:pyrophosphatase PpaX